MKHHNLHKRSRLAALLLLVALAAAGARKGRADEIILHSGQRISDIEIKSARWDSVSYDVNGQVARKAGDDIAELQRASSRLGSARKALEQGKFSAAAKAFKSLAENLDGWEKAEALYGLAQTYHRAGSKKAEATYKAYLDAFREEKDWFVPRAIEGLADFALSQGQGNTAANYYKQLAEFGKNWSLRASLGQGRGFMAAKKYEEARRAYNKIASDRRAPDNLRQEAVAGRAEAMVGQNFHAEAIKELKSGFFRPGIAVAYSRSRARATYLMGLAYQGQGGKENLERAEIWFLKVAALYASYPEEYQGAVRQLISVYDELGLKDRASQWKARLQGS